jgi:hypothetical protein
VVWTGTEFLAVSANNYVTASSDGITWVTRNTSSNAFNALTASSFGSVGLIAVGTNGTGGPIIRTSSNAGGFWANRNAAAAGTNILNGVAANTTIAVAVGAGGIIVTSFNGTTWNLAPSGVTSPLYGVVWTGNVFVAVGAGGVVLTSPDGTNWTSQSPGTGTALYAVHWSGSLVVAAGATGTIMTSSPDALPPVPTQSTPSAGETAVPVNPLFSWNPVGGATSYTVQVSTTAGFVDTLIDSTVTGTSLLHGPLATGTQYFWRVRANGGTGSSPWSDPPMAFTTTPAPSAAPVLASPAANATDISLSTTLSWNAYAGATSYRIQVDTGSNFESMLVNDSVGGTQRILGGLLNSTVYHWRVYARLPSGVTAWSTARQFTTTAPAPPTPVLATPANGAIAVPLSATLTWNASTGASNYRVQVATASDFSVIFKDSIVAGATSMALPGLAVNGVYYWRVQARNAAGGSAFSTGRNFTTATSAPAAPAPASPTAGALDVSVYTALTWSPADGAVTYRLQLSTSSTFATTLVDDATLTGTSYTPAAPLNQTTTYYWRLSATNPVGTSAFSIQRSFTTGLAPTGPPAPPALLSPAQFASNVTASPTLTWNPSATATAYHVQVSTSLTFETLITEDTVTGTSLAIGPLAGSTSYYWQVRAINQLGAGEWSQPNLFATATVVPAAPSLIAPEQYATGVAVSPTLSWSAVNGAAGYRVQVSTNFNFSGSLVLNDSVTATSRALGPLADNTNYYWRVYAANAAGASDWSGTHLFTTGTAPIPEVPVLLTPTQFAVDVPRTGVTLTWSPVTGATSYRVQISTSGTNFNTPLVDDSLGTSPARGTGPLAERTTYFWRVRAKNNTGVSDFSLPNRFTTDGPVSILMGRVLVSGAGLGGDRTLRFGMPRAGRVTVKAYDTRGNEVAAVFDGDMQAGEHAIALPATLRRGVHLLDFRAGDFRAVVKTAP